MAQITKLRVAFGILKIFISIYNTHCHYYQDQNNHEWFGFLEIPYRDIYYFFKYVFHLQVPEM